MKRSEMLKAALEKSSTLEEAKEFVGWMQEFLDGDKEEASQPTTAEMLKATEKVKEILIKPIDDPAFHVDLNQLPLDWDAPPKRTRKQSEAKKAGHKILQEDLEFVARKLPTIKTEEEFDAMANELGRSSKGIKEWVNRDYVKIDHLLLPRVVFPKLYKWAVEAAKAKAEANV